MERTKQTSNTEKQILAMETFSSDSFLAVNKRLLSHFGPNITVFLSNLIDKYKYFKGREKLEEDGSFFLRYKDQIEHTGMSEYELRNCKKKLKKYGILETYTKGIPAKEFYHINFDVLVEEFLRSIPLNFQGLDLKNFKGNGSGNLRDIKETEYKETEYKETGYKSLSDPLGSDGDTNNRSKSSGEKSIQERNKEYLPKAERLAEIVQADKNVKISYSKLKSWSNEIRKITEQDGVDPSRIDAALDWYANNIGGDFVPAVQSGVTLRKKFINLEDAIKRDNNPPQNNSSKQPTQKTSPKSIIKQANLPRISAEDFIEECYEPAKEILTCTGNGQLPELASKLVNLYKDVCNRQKEAIDANDIKYGQEEYVMAPKTIVSRYILWLGNRDWIEDKQPNLFNPNHTLFNNRFLNWLQEENTSRNPITGTY